MGVGVLSVSLTGIPAEHLLDESVQDEAGGVNYVASLFRALAGATAEKVAAQVPMRDVVVSNRSSLSDHWTQMPEVTGEKVVLTEEQAKQCEAYIDGIEEALAQVHAGLTAEQQSMLGKDIEGLSATRAGIAIWYPRLQVHAHGENGTLEDFTAYTSEEMREFVIGLIQTTDRSLERIYEQLPNLLDNLSK